MTEKLETVLEKVSSIANPVNSSLIQEFYQYMADNHKSDSYKKHKILRRKSLGLGDDSRGRHSA
jgi:hypothetical protein